MLSPTLSSLTPFVSSLSSPSPSFAVVGRSSGPTNLVKSLCFSLSHYSDHHPAVELTYQDNMSMEVDEEEPSPTMSVTNEHVGNNEHSRVQDHVSIHIESMLCDVPLTSPKHTIFKVRRQLREVNKKAYDPQILAIGPYHYGNNKFKFMEVQKRRYLKQLLERKGQSVRRYTRTLIKEEQRARDHYAETIGISQERFLAMMIIDGCFIIELFRKYAKKKKLRGHAFAEGSEDSDDDSDSALGRAESEYDPTESDSEENDSAEGRDKSDPVMYDLGIRHSVRRDLLLLENQLPFFVLSNLYDLTRDLDEDHDLIDVAAMYLKTPSRIQEIGMTKHLLHLYHMCRTSGLRKTKWLGYVAVMPSAAELRESGVRFQAVEEQKLVHIIFENGTLKIPVLYVHDDIESKFRNLIAYEQHRQGKDITYFTDYVKFMDCLINSSKDVAVLRHAGIIKNYLGDDEVLARMFNKMCVNVLLRKSYYSDIYQKVNMHRAKRMNIWMAKLRREYFHSPWAFLSVVAAIVLLLLTAAQTVFAALSYPN